MMSETPPIHVELMDRAIALATLGGRATLPNPNVGCVVARGGEILGEGYHHNFGGPHAEVNAIANVSNRDLLPSATLYVTLEPCSHFGKTPPCVDRILESGIRHVVIGCRDPFPAVSGRGIQKLLDAGVEVVEDVRHDECILINKRFILAHSLGRPYIVLKWAQTRDGFIAPPGRERTQISCHHSQLLVHQWRSQEMACAVGVRTACIDNPQLTVRYTNLCTSRELPVRNPVRVVIGESAHLTQDLALYNADAETILFSTRKIQKYRWAKNIRVLRIQASEPVLPQIFEALYKHSILSVLIEGGAHTLHSCLESGLWDEARVFTAPITFGAGLKAPVLAQEPRAVVESGVDTLHMFHNPELPGHLQLRE